MTQEKRWWMGYTRNGKEFEVFDQLEALGIDHWRGKRIEFERRGKDRTPEPHEYPALPNYVFIHPEPGQLWQLRGVKHLSPMLEPLGRLSLGGSGPSPVVGLMKFMEASENRLSVALRAIGNRQAIAEFKEGEQIEVKDGAFAGCIATFRSRVQRAHDPFPKIVADMEFMGGKTRVELDPLDVRKAV